MRTLISLAFLILTASTLGSAQSDSGVEDGTNLRGQIRYQDNTPAPFVQVELWTDGESTWRKFVQTDRMGRFVSGAPCMIVKYKVDTPGYRPVEGQVDMSINPCRTLIDISLHSSAKPKAPGSETASPEPIDARIVAIPPEAKVEFDAGLGAVDANDFAGAIPHLQKAIVLYPRYAEAYQLLGVAQLQMNQGPEAEASLAKAIEIEDRMPRAQYLLGVLYARTGRANLAEKPFTRFAELDPSNPDAHFELAKVSFALKKFPDAETHARKAIDLKEPNSGVYVVLGYSLLRQRKADDAKQAFQKFLELDPKSAMAADLNKLMTQLDERSRGGAKAN